MEEQRRATEKRDTVEQRKREEQERRAREVSCGNTILVDISYYMYMYVPSRYILRLRRPVRGTVCLKREHSASMNRSKHVVLFCGSSLLASEAFTRSSIVCCRRSERERQKRETEEREAALVSPSDSECCVPKNSVCTWIQTAL